MRPHRSVIRIAALTVSATVAAAAAATAAAGSGSSSRLPEDSGAQTATTATTSQPETIGDELVLVVGGTGRVGRRVVTRLAALGVRVRVLTRDPKSPAAAELIAACSQPHPNASGGGGGGGGARARGGAAVELVRGDVTDVTEGGEENLRRATQGCTQVIACFGAQRVAKITDVFTKPEDNDPAHPAAVNYRGVARLAAAAAAAGTVRRFVRVTGMSAGMGSVTWTSAGVVDWFLWTIPPTG